jgi:hypothetical protein
VSVVSESVACEACDFTEGYQSTYTSMLVSLPTARQRECGATVLAAWAMLHTHMYLG